MSQKRTGLGSRPSRPTATVDADKWVESRVVETTAPQPAEPEKVEQAEQPKKKLIIELTQEMHTRLKSKCAERGVKMSDIVRDMINKEFPPV